MAGSDPTAVQPAANQTCRRSTKDRYAAARRAAGVSPAPNPESFAMQVSAGTTAITCESKMAQ